jgi:hypothetical protein
MEEQIRTFFMNLITLDTLVKFLQLVPGVFVTGFTLYFAYRKIFYKVAIYFNLHSDRISAERLDNIVLINEKDRPVVLNEIVALFNNQDYLSVHKFEPPQILKPESGFSDPIPFWIDNSRGSRPK